MGAFGVLKCGLQGKGHVSCGDGVQLAAGTAGRLSSLSM